MSEVTEDVLEKVIKFGAAFTEVSSPLSSRQDANTYQLNGILKTAFSFAEVTFEVCARLYRIRSRSNARMLALTETK
jgi:hypothetical protein